MDRYFKGSRKIRLRELGQSALLYTLFDCLLIELRRAFSMFQPDNTAVIFLDL